MQHRQKPKEFIAFWLPRGQVREPPRTRRDAKQIYYSLLSKEAEQVMGLLYELFCEDDNDGAKDAVDTTDKIEEI